MPQDEINDFSKRNSDRPHPSILRQILSDLKWIVPLLLLAGPILIPDEASSVVYFVCGIVFLFLAISFLVRRLLFPWLNLERTMRVAHDHPLGAAIIFASVAWLVGTIFQASLSLLR